MIPNLPKIIDDLFHEAMDTGDYGNETEGNVLEIGMISHHSLMKEYNWWEMNCHQVDGEWWFRGTFKIMVIHDMSLSTIAFDETKADWHHAAIHLRRANGRMRYFDWEGNDRDLL